MDEQPKVALVIARPGPLRNSLFSLLHTLPQIEIVAEGRELPVLLRMGDKMQPNLVLMESDWPEDHIHESLRQIKKEWTAARTVVLVDNVKQQRETKLAGADVVLIKGIRAANLMKIVEGLLSSNGIDSEQGCVEGLPKM